MGWQAGPAGCLAAPLIQDHVVPDPVDMAQPLAPADDPEPAIVEQLLRRVIGVQYLGLQGPVTGGL